jgi:hypothetical protein
MAFGTGRALTNLARLWNEVLSKENKPVCSLDEAVLVSVQRLKKAAFPGLRPSEDVLYSEYEEEKERKDNRIGPVLSWLK